MASDDSIAVCGELKLVSFFFIAFYVVMYLFISFLNGWEVDGFSLYQRLQWWRAMVCH